MKRAALLAIVMILIVGICAPAFAAYYPVVTLVKRPTKVWRGSTMYATYRLNSNSFNYKNGYRANYDIYIFRQANNKRYSWGDWDFTGRVNHRISTYVATSWPRGTYRTRVRAWYRRYAYNRWSSCGSFWWNFTVK